MNEPTRVLKGASEAITNIARVCTFHRVFSYWCICWAWDAMYWMRTNVEAGLIYPKGILDLHIAALAAPEAAQLPLARRVTSIEPGHPQLLPLNGYSCQALSQLMPSREIFGPPNLGVKLKIKREQHFKRISLLILGFWSLTAWKTKLGIENKRPNQIIRIITAPKRYMNLVLVFLPGRWPRHMRWGAPCGGDPKPSHNIYKFGICQQKYLNGGAGLECEKIQGEGIFKYRIPLKSGNCSLILLKIC